MGRPFTLSGNAGLYARREELSPTLRDQSKRALEAMAQDLLNEILMAKAVAPDPKLAQYLDVTQGPFATGEGVFAPGYLELIPTRGRK